MLMEVVTWSLKQRFVFVEVFSNASNEPLIVLDGLPFGNTTQVELQYFVD
jgi:hypothetical protein